MTERFYAKLKTTHGLFTARCPSGPIQRELSDKDGDPATARPTYKNCKLTLKGERL